MTVPRTIILVEDDAALRHAIVQGLELAGFSVHAHADAESALAAIGPALDGVVLTDVRLPRMDGLELLARVRGIDGDIPVVVITGHGDVPMAVAALKQGAFDFLTKPFAMEHLSSVLGRALERRGLLAENRALRAAVAEAEAEAPMIGTSGSMTAVRAALRRLAAADLDALVEGESGTGKSLAAALLHRLGPRRARPLIAVDLATTPPEQAGWDLFGHAADSVPHTRLSRTGAIALSSGGTLLLENIDRADPALQLRLLRVLEEREVLPVGADRAEAVNPRIVATRDGRAAGLRPELHHRLSPGRIVLPPLRAREQDRLLLFQAFFAEAWQQLGGSAPPIPTMVADRVQGHDWPGNVRELRGYAFEVATGAGGAHGEDRVGLRERTAAFERAAIVGALERTQGNVVGALDLLKLPRKTLYEKFARYEIRPDSYRPDRR